MECKYMLPCGRCELKDTLCTFEFPVKETSNSLASSEEYREAINFLKREVAVTIKNVQGRRYYEMAIDALKRERDTYFPGVFTKKEVKR